MEKCITSIEGGAWLFEEHLSGVGALSAHITCNGCLSEITLSRRLFGRKSCYSLNT